MNSVIKIAFLLISLIYVFQRIWNNYSSKKRIKDISKNLDSEDFVISLIEGLDTFVIKEKVEDFDKIRLQLEGGKQIYIQNFEIKAFKKVEENIFLFVTVGKYIEYDKKKEIPHFVDLCFKVVLDNQDGSIKIYSELYIDLNDKNLRYDFGKNLIKLVK